ncbi:cytochrome c oxidase assembly protein [Elioraea sp. Yellowstone]|jgi:cytochrome c oxidase assembly protein subunit 11|uniref:cytochrome c oxidase assembly protein n=1 Tax=Elioraea sp. Yellowstone TaxID=2592070 RepID=UPI00114D6188|nr:cytochrome c oxidase assembly protein [Elioraea sp. Yellowstone]TQF78731.1 cytochrome c oxidase assembly protein [Elioraea sp. Yellowstone]
MVPSRRNRTVALTCLGVVALMVGAAFAAVPLYDLFCRVTGYGGTPMVNPDVPAQQDARRIRVEFVANVNAGLPWTFRPAQRAVTLHGAEEGVAFYLARNDSDRPVTGISTYNVTPEKAAPYFNKIACFCFTEQTLAPGQQVEMPLAFWVDPKMFDDPATRDVRVVTVSYTFYRSLDDAQRAGALAAAGPHVGGFVPNTAPPRPGERRARP